MFPFRKIAIILAVVFGVVCGGIVGYVFAGYVNLPDIKALQEYTPPVSTRIYSDNGRLIGELFQQKRELLVYGDIPPLAIQAVLAVEDAHFFHHRGIRIISLLRALLADIRARRIVQGGSTITQQLAKTLFLTPDKTFSRKMKEIMLALQLELNFTKREILTYYFNQIYFGSGAYGVEAAAQVYFGKSAKNLTLSECALIGALPRAPSIYSPISNMGKARARRAYVLSRMRDEGYISEAQRSSADLDPITLAMQPSMDQAPYFMEMVRQELELRYGSTEIYRQGLEVYTTLNIEMQKAAQESVMEGVRDIETRNRKRISHSEGLPVQAALIAIEPTQGAIKAMVGGLDFRQSQFNRAVQAHRQPGSSFKPILYAAALENGWTPASKIIDAPLELEDPAHSERWKPVNYDNRFFGPVSLRFALANSLNVAAVKLYLSLGPQKTIEMARRLGIVSEMHPYPSLALGGSEVTLQELVSAYAVFANHGQLIKPHLITLVRHANLATDSFRPSPTEVVRPTTAFLVTSLLRSVVESGTGKIAQKLGRQVAAKTGTTDDYTDAWFVGYSPQLAAGVWVGYDIKKSLGEGETGARAAGPIWSQFMTEALAGKEVEEFEKPDGIVQMDVDVATGLKADQKCGPSIGEYFLEGTQPSQSCIQQK